MSPIYSPSLNIIEKKYYNCTESVYIKVTDGERDHVDVQMFCASLVPNLLECRTRLFYPVQHREGGGGGTTTSLRIEYRSS